jgi:hypothetical protein
MVACGVQGDIRSVINAQLMLYPHTMFSLKNKTYSKFRRKSSLLKQTCIKSELGLTANRHGLYLSDNIKTFVVTCCAEMLNLHQNVMQSVFCTVPLAA